VRRWPGGTSTRTAIGSTLISSPASTSPVRVVSTIHPPLPSVIAWVTERRRGSVFDTQPGPAAIAAATASTAASAASRPGRV